jgi:glycosyltransferase involved in cell wall biosynthesis
MSQPLVSVIVPTFNRSAHLPAALDSILRQTVRDFELIVVDDGSRDDTPALLGAIADPRLRVVTHSANRGIAQARNSGLDAARGKYIAWLDSDDVSRLDRLARQVRFLERHPNIALAGGCAGKIRADGRPHGHIRVPPFDPAAIRCWLLFKSAFQQSSVMGRAEVLKGRRYDPTFLVCEDVDMFARLGATCRLANIPAVLVDRRMHDGQVSRERRGLVLAAQARISAPQLAALGMEFTGEDLLRHAALARVAREPHTAEYVAWAQDWLARLTEANRSARLVDPSALSFLVNFLRFQLQRRVGRGPLRSAINARVVSRQGVSWVARAAPAAVRQEFTVRTSA